MRAHERAKNVIWPCLGKRFPSHHKMAECSPREVNERFVNGFSGYTRI